MRATEFESASHYVPGGAVFTGAGPMGIEALVAAAGPRWWDCLTGEETYAEIERAVHHREVDGATVWGLHIPTMLGKD